MTQLGSTKYRHGRRHEPEYEVWKGMRARVRGVNHIGYARYKHLTVDPFFDNYENFITHVGRRPSDAHWLERKDNAVGYVRGNLTWATPTEQARNTRRNKLVTLGGVTLTLVEWCEVKGLTYSTIRKRLRMGWNDEDAILKPVRQGNYRRKI